MTYMKRATKNAKIFAMTSLDRKVAGLTSEVLKNAALNIHERVVKGSLTSEQILYWTNREIDYQIENGVPQPKKEKVKDRLNQSEQRILALLVDPRSKIWVQTGKGFRREWGAFMSLKAKGLVSELETDDDEFIKRSYISLKLKSEIIDSIL